MANWFAVCRKDGGALVSLGTVVANPLPAHLEAVPCEAPDNSLEWNPSTKAFVVAAPKVKMIANFLADPEVKPFLDKLTVMEKQFLRTKIQEHFGDV